MASEHYRMKPAARIEQEFSKTCGEIEDDLSQILYDLTRKNVITESKLVDQLCSSDEPIYDPFDIQDFLGEVGCPICRDKTTGKLFLGAVSEPLTGAGCRIQDKSCERMGGEYIGSFHTHPLGGNTPSEPDINCALEKDEEIMCIGGTINDKHTVTCYTPGPAARNSAISARLAWGYYPKPDEDPACEVEFYREVPPPTADDLLETLDPRTVKEIITDVYRLPPEDPEVNSLASKFLETLAAGEIPDEYYEYEGGESIGEGEIDTFEIYSPDASERIDRERKEYMKYDFFMRDIRTPRKR